MSAVVSARPARREHALVNARSAGLALAALAVVVLAPLALKQAPTYDGIVMKRVAIGIARHGNPLVKQPDDQFGFNQPYSGYGIGLSLLMAPLYLAGRALFDSGVRWMNLANVLCFAATGLVVYEIVRRRGYSLRICLYTTGAVALCSPLLAYAINDFSEPAVALMVACGLLALDGVQRGTRYAALGVGAATGGAVLFRTDSIVLIGIPFAAALLMISRDRLRDGALAVAAATPALAVWMAYNAARFGSLLSSGYGNQRFNHPFWSGVYGLTLSPGRGIFVYAPVVLAAFVVFRSLPSAERVTTGLAITLLVARVLFFASWWAWYSGNVWGPRFLLPVLPAFAPCVAAAIARWPRSPLLLFAVGWTAMLSIMGLSTTMHPERNRYVVPPAHDTPVETVRSATGPHAAGYVDRVMFDWGRFF